MGKAARPKNITVGSHHIARPPRKNEVLSNTEGHKTDTIFPRDTSRNKDKLDELKEMSSLASARFNEGRVAEAEQLYLYVVSTRKDLLGDEHLDTLWSMYSLAITYQKQGRLNESESLDAHVLAVRKRVLGDEHLDTLWSMYSLAVTYRKQGRLNKSESLHTHVLAVRKRVLGDEHLDTLSSMHSLAITYSEQGRLDESESLHAHVLAVRKRVLGDEHLDTLSSMHELAVTYSKQGRLNESESLDAHVLAVRKRVLGDEHLDTLLSMHNLATSYYKQGRLDESESLHAHVLAVRKRVLGDEHLDTLSSMRNLAVTYFKQGRLNESESLGAHVLAVRKRLLSDDYPDMPTDNEPPRIMNEHGKIYHKSLEEDGNTGSSPAHMDLASDVLQQPQIWIGTKTPILDALSYLIQHNCLDLTSHIDMPKCSTVALAGGRFGDVWRGALDDGTQVAIKCLRLYTHTAADLKAVKRATRELYYWSKLRHRNVLELIGFAHFQGQLAMISPWMENETLKNYVSQNPAIDRWALCIQVAEGLEYIHSDRMVHGDLKASNVLVSADGLAKLSDFGNSVLAEHSLAFTATNTAGGGTPRWMAPELIVREDIEAADRSVAADVYALGMTVLEVMTGRKPYCEYKREISVTLAAIKGEHPRRPVEISTQTVFGDERWEAMVMCWNIQPSDRPTAGEFKDVMIDLW